MAPFIRPARDHELAAVAAVLGTVSGRDELPALDLEESDRDVVGADRTLVVLDGDRIVGATSSEAVELTVPGGTTVPAAKIGFTGLLPGYRRHGLGGAMFDRQLPDLRAGGDIVATLMTAHSGTPGRHGFSTAVRAASVTVAAGAGARLDIPTDERRVHVVDRTDATEVLPDLFDRHRRDQAGQLSRSGRFWRHWFADDPALRIGDSGRFFAVCQDVDGRPEGYLTFRFDHGPLRERPLRGFVLEDLIAVGDASRRALWDFALHVDPTLEVSAWNLPVDEPLRWMTSGAATVQVTAVRDFLRLRLLDVPGALSRRRYAVEGRLVLCVADPVLPGNDDSFLLVGSPAGATCARTDLPPDLVCSVSALAAAYLGDTTFTTLARAGRVTAGASEALARADAMFATPQAPWTVTDW